MSNTTTQERSRTFSWGDPMAGATAARSMSGLEYLQAIGRGELPPPPIMALMNIEPVEVESGRMVFAVTPEEYHYNPIGSVHGGVAATICDSAMACAIHTTLPAGVGYTTLELKVNFVRPITVQTGRVTCEGTLIHVGGRVATAEARLTDAAGAL
ncbi:MAG: PaaI family thioesterase, partial [Chloroflexales bacterium]|nr:PaaI family thioesterase [Chloroflexales bacterium]